MKVPQKQLALTPFPGRGSVAALLTVGCLALASAAQAQSPITILDVNFESPVSNMFSYPVGDATRSQAIVSGEGVGGSSAGVLTANFFAGPNGYAGAGIQISTTSNPNTTVTDPNDIWFSFDARSTTPNPGAADFYVQTWPGFYGHPMDGTVFGLFQPTSVYQTFTFSLASLTGGTVNPTHQTMQLNWQLATWHGTPLGTNNLEIDNIRVTAVPEPGLMGLLTATGIAGMGCLRRRRRK